MYPGVQTNVSKSNLQRIIKGDTVGAFIISGFSTVIVGKVQEIYDLADAVSKGISETEESFGYKILKEFYTELGGKQKIYVLGVAGTEEMQDIVSSTNEEGLKKLIRATNGSVGLVAIARNPDNGYNAGLGFLDSDVQATVTASLALCQSLQQQNRPIRMLIEGRVANGEEANTFKPNTASNGFAGVVLGGTEPDGSAAIGLAMARACKYAAHIKLGCGENGPLSANQIYIGETKIEERLDAETLHDDGFITFYRPPDTAGYYFGVDNMASDDDFKILVHGRVMDKVQRIIVKAAQPYIEKDTDVDADGSPDDIYCAHLESVFANSVKTGMGNQISDIKVMIDSGQTGIVNTSNMNVEVSVLPKGYTTWLTFNMGLTSSL